MKIEILILALGLWAAAGPAGAQPALPAKAAPAAAANDEAALPPACAGDVETFCAESRSRGQEAVQSCMKVHKDDLSESCKDVLRKKTAPAAAAAPVAPPEPAGPPSCTRELGQFCKGVRKVGGSSVDCLREHERELSHSCRKRIAQAGAEKLKNITRACSNEAQMLCHGVSSDKLLRCLFRNQPNATKACRDAFEEARPFMGPAKKAAASGQ